MIRHALEKAPLECCGLLFGPSSTPQYIESISPMRNIMESPTEFSIDPQELINSLRDRRSSGQQLIGIYHSHPNSKALPSFRDTSEFYYHDVSYWIISLISPAKPSLRCFRWLNRGFLEQNYSVTTSPYSLEQYEDN